MMDVPLPPRPLLRTIEVLIALEQLDEAADDNDRDAMLAADLVFWILSHDSDEALAEMKALKDLFAPHTKILYERAQHGQERDQVHERNCAYWNELLTAIESRTLYLGTAKNPKDAAILAELVTKEENPPLIAMGLDGGQVVIGAGIPGSGKSQAILCLTESALRSIRGISRAATTKRAVIAIHNDLEGDRLPQLLEGLLPNNLEPDLEFLKETFNQKPAAIGKMRVVLPRSLMKHYEPLLAPYVALGLEIKPLRIPFSQLGQSALEVLIAGSHPESLYVQHIMEEARDLGENLTIEALRKRIDAAGDMNSAQKFAAHRRLRLLQEVTESDGDVQDTDLWDLVEPGVTTIFMLGGTRIGKDALALAATIISAVMQPSKTHGAFQRVVVIDEVNNFDEAGLTWGPIVRLGRQIRHAGSILLIFGQDLNKLPPEMLGLASMMLVFRVGNPSIYDYIQKHLGGFSKFPYSKIADLDPGTAALATINSWGQDWGRHPYGNHARVVRFRPPLAMHGGHTKAAT